MEINGTDDLEFLIGQIEYQSLSGRKTRLANFNRLVGHTVRGNQ